MNSRHPPLIYVYYAHTLRFHSSPPQHRRERETNHTCTVRRKRTRTPSRPPPSSPKGPVVKEGGAKRERGGVWGFYPNLNAPTPPSVRKPSDLPRRPLLPPRRRHNSGSSSGRHRPPPAHACLTGRRAPPEPRSGADDAARHAAAAAAGVVVCARRPVRDADASDVCCGGPRCHGGGGGWCGWSDAADQEGATCLLHPPQQRCRCGGAGRKALRDADAEPRAWGRGCRRRRRRWQPEGSAAVRHRPPRERVGGVQTEPRAAAPRASAGHPRVGDVR